MNLIQKLKSRLKPSPPMPAKSLLTPDQEERLRQDVNKVLDPLPPTPGPPKRQGRVIKQTRATEFNPNTTRHGGRVVRVMPKKLQQIKQAQEKVEDDSPGPSLADLEE